MMSKGKPIGRCETCGSEIVETVNDSQFAGGECAACEELRYRTQPELLRLANSLRNACEDCISILSEEQKEGIGNPDDIQDQIDHWKSLQRRCDQALARAVGGMNHQQERR